MLLQLLLLQRRLPLLQVLQMLLNAVAMQAQTCRGGHASQSHAVLYIQAERVGGTGEGGCGLWEGGERREVLSWKHKPVGRDQAGH